LQQPVDQIKVISPDIPLKVVSGNYVKDPSLSAASASSLSSSSPNKVRVRTLKQMITFEVPPQPLYETLTDERKIGAFTQAPCKFPLEAGKPFEMFAGNVQGIQVCLEQSKKIEQKWRFKAWPENHYSKVVMEFKEVNGKTELTLSQSDVPDSDFERTKAGWEEYFWTRIRGIFGWHYKLKNL